MSVQQLQQLSSRSVVRDGIAGGTQAVEVIVAGGVCVKAATKVHVWLLRVLLFVQAIRRCVPDIDLDVGDGFAGGVVCDCAVHVCHVAALIFVDDGVSEGAFGGTLAPERAEDLERIRMKERQHAVQFYLPLWQ